MTYQTPSTRPFPRRRLRLSALVLASALTLGTAACAATPADSTATPSTSTAVVADSTTSSLFDSSAVHDIEITVDEADVDAAVATYLAEDDKTWITASVTIDGQVFEEVGLRLKGNSSLRTITTADSGTPQDLPWLVRLDKYVDGQSLDGVTSFVIRSNTTETALNEAVALDLIGLTGLATEEATASRLSFNGGEESLRLVIENPDDAWAASEFTTVGTLYKAESTGDYTYRGDDPDDYDEVFDLEAGTEDYAPLTEFLQFINESDDATFGAELGDHLDVEAFATYLAVQELVSNADDIDGRGNNSYLHYDPDTGLMTVVAWDQNLSFGVQNVGMGGPGDAQPDAAGDAAAGGAGAGPELQPPAGVDPGGAGGGAGGGAAEPQGSNVLSERFLADDTFGALYTERLAELTEELYTSGAADDTLASWTAVLTAGAADLVSEETIESEAASIAAYFD